jgi:DNA-binding NtrC family response regulator
LWLVMSKVLIVDDQPAACLAIQVLLETYGIDSLIAHSPSDAIDLVAAEDLSAVVQDMNFAPENTSGQEGVELFRAIKKLDPDLPIILLTTWSSLATAVQLVKEGANDYMAKPWDDEKLVRTVQTLGQMRTFQQESARARAQTSRMRRTLAARFDLCGLVYASPQMHNVVSLAATVAGSDVPILITGANGSGKEKLAEIVQTNSRRKSGPFVKVNAGALPDSMLEAELFGAEVGAYTGATKMRVGRFEAAHEGTLFLDEIGNLSPAGQAKLLRVLQTGEFERLGSSGTRKVDVRIVSATNIDLPRAIADGKFREDLFFRLNVIELHIPPLVERADDVLPLAEFFLETLSGQEMAPPLRLGDDARASLLQYEWPGNVRELQNRIQRAKLVCTDGVITREHLGFTATGTTTPSSRTTGPNAILGLAAPTGGTPAGGLAASDDRERAAVEQALLNAGGVVSKAAMEMGMSRQALYRRMERVGIVPERRPKA